MFSGRFRDNARFKGSSHWKPFYGSELFRHKPTLALLGSKSSRSLTYLIRPLNMSSGFYLHLFRSYVLIH